MIHKKHRKLVRFKYAKWKPAPDWVYQIILEEMRQDKLNTWKEVDARKWVLLYSELGHDIISRQRLRMVGHAAAVKANKLQSLEGVAVTVCDDESRERVEQTINDYLLLFGTN